MGADLWIADPCPHCYDSRVPIRSRISHSADGTDRSGRDIADTVPARSMLLRWARKLSRWKPSWLR